MIGCLVPIIVVASSRIIPTIGTPRRVAPRVAAVNGDADRWSTTLVNLEAL
jgi:hypothetical protein